MAKARKVKRGVIRCLAELDIDKEGNGVIVLTGLNVVVGERS